MWYNKVYTLSKLAISQIRREQVVSESIRISMNPSSIVLKPRNWGKFCSALLKLFLSRNLTSQELEIIHNFYLRWIPLILTEEGIRKPRKVAVEQLI